MFTRNLRAVRHCCGRRWNSTGAGKQSSRWTKFVWPATLFLSGSAVGFYFALKQTLALPPEFLFPHSSKTSLDDIPPPAYGSQLDFELAVARFKQLLQKEGQISNSPNDIEGHTKNSYTLHEPLPSQRPSIILYPETTEEVSEVLKICHDLRIPILPYSGGTSLESQFVSTRNGVILDLSRMNKIIKLNKDDLDITVQAGVGWEEINELVNPDGLMLGPDPGPGALVGGMIGTSCSGTNASRYGTMKENVVNLTVVLADGTVIKTKRRPKKASNGYNLTGLFIGSEGTLGVITEATLKLHTKPKVETVAVVSFNSLLDATNCVTKFIQQGLQLNAIELLDDKMMTCINHSDPDGKWLEKPTLFVKIGGNNSKILKELVKQVEKICYDNNSVKFKYAKSETEQTNLWRARKSIFWASIDYGRKTISPNVKIWSTDAAVPISNLTSVIEGVQNDIAREGLYGTIVGHVGDGNYHCLLMYEEKDVEKANRLIASIVDRSLNAEGTCSGEHGVGFAKRHHLLKELGVDTIDVMRKIKFSLDPLRILNPDKLFKIDPNDQFD